MFIRGRIDHHRKLTLSRGDVFSIASLGLVLVLAVAGVRHITNSGGVSPLLVSLGAVATWRYCWWMVHFIRSAIYARWIFPPMREGAEALWARGWRPARINFMVTTFQERPETTRKVFTSIVAECRALGVPARIVVGTGHESDELVIENLLQAEAPDDDIHLVFVRQNIPGKRAAIGLALRALSRLGVNSTDIVIFMDGDTFLEPGLLRRCIPIFELKPELDAVTTDERVIVHGPRWFQSWLNLRFTQRHLSMQSHALSGRLMTLTGRLSIFRAHHVVTERFIRLVEADHLDNWLWGRFRFLSGDDKSTVFALFSAPGKRQLLYVPDAVACTIEHIEGGGANRMLDNVLRWSGNTLRNGTRMMGLGPQRMGFFIWWCLIDQRVAMWTSLVGPLSAILLAHFVSPMWIIVSAVWILSTRFLLSLALFVIGGKVDLSYVWLLYCNQLLVSMTKVYMLFRLPKQRWANRGQRQVLNPGLSAHLKTASSIWLNGLYVMGLVMGILYLARVFPVPAQADFLRFMAMK